MIFLFALLFVVYHIAVRGERRNDVLEAADDIARFAHSGCRFKLFNLSVQFFLIDFFRSGDKYLAVAGRCNALGCGQQFFV